MLFQQNGDRSEKNEGKERIGKFVVSGCNPAKMLELVEKALDQMTLFVKPPVTFPLVNPVYFGRDRVPGILIFDIYKDFVGIISTISQHHATCQMDVGKYIGRNLAVVHITSR